jgi:hypothetical protein
MTGPFAGARPPDRHRQVRNQAERGLQREVRARGSSPRPLSGKGVPEHEQQQEIRLMQDTQTSTATPTSPVDDATYDLLQALTSKLEAIEAYQLYAEDEGVRDLFERLGRDEVQHAEDLLEALRQRLNGR